VELGKIALVCGTSVVSVDCGKEGAVAVEFGTVAVDTVSTVGYVVCVNLASAV
jgi:hypothetical protein